MRPHYRSRAGHTLVEVVVACVVFAAGVLALQRAMLMVAVQARDAHLLQLAAQAASSHHERMVGTPCHSALAGSAVDRGIGVHWQAGPLLGAHSLRTSQRLEVPQSSGMGEHVHTGAVRCR